MRTAALGTCVGERKELGRPVLADRVQFVEKYVTFRRTYEQLE